MLLSLISAVFFALSNMFVGDLSKKGIESYYYWGSGSLIISVGYFIYQKECCKKNVEQNLSDGLITETSTTRKVLLRTWDNNFDCHAFGVLIFFACYEAGIVASILITFKVA